MPSTASTSTLGALRPAAVIAVARSASSAVRPVKLGLLRGSVERLQAPCRVLSVADFRGGVSISTSVVLESRCCALGGYGSSGSQTQPTVAVSLTLMATGWKAVASTVALLRTTSSKNHVDAITARTPGDCASASFNGGASSSRN